LLNHDALARRCACLIGKYFLTFKVRTCSAIVRGWDCLVVEVNGTYMFRFARRPEVKRQLAKETLLLPRLAETLSVPVPNPEFICAHPEADDPAFIGYRKIYGEPLVRGHLSCNGVSRLAQGPARFLSELHGFPLEEAKRLKVPYLEPPRWRRRYEALYRWVSRAVLPLLEAPAQRELSLLWRSFLDCWVGSDFLPVLVHGDLTADHILCDPSPALLTGIIDWGDATVGDAALDFAGLLYSRGPEFTQQILAMYQHDVDASFWQRASFYSKIVPIHEIRFALATGEERHLESGLDLLVRSLSAREEQ
jgi:aminoglycoside 2''-phosphotransferase